MSQIRFIDGQILFDGGSIAMSEDCCCPECDCTELGVRITPCETCIDSEYPLSTGDFGTVNDWLITISGVTNGTATTPGGGTGCFNYGSCNTTVSSNYGMFNAGHVVAPCSTVTIEECHYLGCFEAYDAVSKLFVMERNRLAITTNTTGGVGSSGLHTVGVAMRSSQYLVLAPNGSSEATLCAIAESAKYFDISIRLRTLGFERDPGTLNTYRYDPELCTTECNEDYIQMACVAAGWQLTEVSDTSVDSNCLHALDFSGATITVEAT